MTAGELELFIVLFVFLSSLWVWLDAPRYGMSRAWGVGSFFLWIVFFPLYLLVRTSQRRIPDQGQPPPPGWYADPDGGRAQRWWDGDRWTEHRQPAPPAAKRR